MIYIGFVYSICIQKCLSANVVMYMTDRCCDANKNNINNSKHDNMPVLFQSHPYIEISIHLGIKCNIYALIPHAASMVWCWYCLSANCHVQGYCSRSDQGYVFLWPPMSIVFKMWNPYGSQKEPYSVQSKLSSHSSITVHSLHVWDMVQSTFSTLRQCWLWI